jgi:O-antigen biosynthesis protein WbqP
MKRLLDLVVAVVAGCLLCIPMALIALLVRLTSRGPALYWSDRIGQYNRVFRMPKFRTMRVGTPPVATHLLTDAQEWLTPIGGFLRRTSLDELPQLWSILRGDMSLVGPRPALFNQDDLIALRAEQGVDQLVPGVTGWAQVNGRDDLSIPIKARLDAEYLRRRSLWFDLRILLLTVLRVLRSEGVAH